MSYKIYSKTQTNLCYNGYKIKINGKEVEADTARVSAVPFNRRWPGYQRSIDQTELVNFLLLETDESLHFEITPPEKSDNVIIRPVSLGINPVVTDDGTIVFTLPKNAYFTVEPYGRKNGLHIFADPVSEHNVDVSHTELIYFGKGEHNAGTIVLKSNQTLFIDEGAVVYACVHAVDAKNIRIIGKGILDNSKNIEQITYFENTCGNTKAVHNAIRQHTIKLEYCTDIEIKGITIRDSLVYNIRLIACKDVNISAVKLIGNWRYNSDGIDMHNCENVSIDNCFIRTFDDCICVKGFDFFYTENPMLAYQKAMSHGGNCYDSFKNISVKNCVLWNDWGRCLEIGAETQAKEICDVRFENCSVIHVSMQVLDCQNVDFAFVHDVFYRNIDIEYDDVIPECIYQQSDDMVYKDADPDYTPAVIEVCVICHPEYSGNCAIRGKNRDIHFENIRLFGRQKPIIHIESYDDEFSSENVYIKDFYHNGKKLDKKDFELQIDKYSKNVIIE